MDQNAFRSFLYEPRPASASASNRSFGITQNRKRDTGPAASKVPAGSSTLLKPRTAQSARKSEAVIVPRIERDFVNNAATRMLEELQAEQQAKEKPIIEPEPVQPETVDFDALLEDQAAAVIVPNEPSVSSKKRTREEILQSLRKDLPPPDERPASKFRKLGSQAIATSDVKPVKKSNKKRKLDPLPPVSHEADASPVSGSAIVNGDVAASQVPLPLPNVPESAAVQGGEDLPDIFANAAEYKPFDDDSDEDDTLSLTQPKSTTDHDPQPSSHAKRNYFGDNTDDEAEPITVPQLPIQNVPADGEEEVEQSSRLQGFEATADIKSLLAADKAAAKEEQRKERKEKMRAKQGLPTGDDQETSSKSKKKLTSADKLNRDFQEFQNYSAKR